MGKLFGFMRSALQHGITHRAVNDFVIAAFGCAGCCNDIFFHRCTFLMTGGFDGLKLLLITTAAGLGQNTVACASGRCGNRSFIPVVIQCCNVLFPDSAAVRADIRHNTCSDASRSRGFFSLVPLVGCALLYGTARTGSDMQLLVLPLPDSIFKVMCLCLIDRCHSQIGCDDRKVMIPTGMQEVLLIVCFFSLHFRSRCRIQIEYRLLLQQCPVVFQECDRINRHLNRQKRRSRLYDNIITGSIHYTGGRHSDLRFPLCSRGRIFKCLQGDIYECRLLSNAVHGDDRKNTFAVLKLCRVCSNRQPAKIFLGALGRRNICHFQQRAVIGKLHIRCRNIAITADHDGNRKGLVHRQIFRNIQPYFWEDRLHFQFCYRNSFADRSALQHFAIDIIKARRP